MWPLLDAENRGTSRAERTPRMTLRLAPGYKSIVSDGSSTMTGTDSGVEVAAPGDGHAPHLFIVLDAAAPLVGAARHNLATVDEVRVGRGDERAALRAGRGLALQLADRRVSTNHARLWRENGLWWLEDLGSKNGCLVNGRACAPGARVPLPDGAAIEIGHTFMRLRVGVPTPEWVPLDGTAPAPADGLDTLLPPLARQFSELARFAATPGAVVVLGETGTGKDVTARAYHALSGRGGPFVPVNCGALPDNLVESLLFGHKRGAFSGATADAAGLVRSAEGGTLFLDELGDLPLASQAALLRVIESREVTPVGVSQPVRVDVRFVAATHRDIPAMIRRGDFRADLWARLCGHVLTLPPLRARREDLGLILAATLRRLAPERAERISLHRDAARTLLARPFPLNVRELVNVVGRALALSDDDTLRAEAFADAAPALSADEAAAPAVEDAHDEGAADLGEDDPRARRRRAQLEVLLDEHRGNVSEVARVLGKARPLVYKWLTQLGIDPAKFRR
jgi:transcriptional regulator with AAA-type ATPase domain